jgi:hypothetical protein
LVDLWCTVRVWLEDWRTRESSRSPRGFVARRNSNGLFSHSVIFFSDRSRRFPINRGRGGGRVRNFFRNFFFFREFWGRGGGRVTPKPEARVARFLLGMFRNRFFEAGVDAKVSPRVAKGRQSVTEGGGGGRKSVTFIF